MGPAALERLSKFANAHGLGVDGATALTDPRRLAVLFLASTGAFYVIAVLVNLLVRDPGGPLDLDALCHFDCYWYGTIAKGGYFPEPPADKFGYSNVTFWPAFPLAAGAATGLFGGDFVLGAIFVNNAAILGTLLLVNGMRRELGLDDHAFTFFVLMVLATPFVLYSRIPYSEAVFNFLLAAVVFAWVKDRFALLAVAGAAFTVSRGIGVFLPVFLSAALVLRHRGNLVALVRSDFGKAAAIALMPLAYVLHSAYLATLTGDPLAFRHVLYAFQAGAILNPFAEAYRIIVVDGNISHLFPFVLALGAAVFVFLQRRRLPAIAPFMYYYLFTIVLALSVTPRSHARYALAIFLLYLLVAAVIKDEERRRDILIGLLAFQFAALASWLAGAGYMV